MTVEPNATTGYPLCGDRNHRPSWVGETEYRGVVYHYVACAGCGSHYLDPMPSDAAVAQMYEANYAAEASTGPDLAITDPKQPERVRDLLTRLPRGTFLDYGCGAGNLLTLARDLGWRAVGIEYDPQVATDTARKTGAAVRTVAEAAYGEPADVLHLGDVIEHLTALGTQFPAILRLLKPGGMLLAQGPLEGNFTIFNGLLQLSRRLRGSPRTHMAPYHVLLATAGGQATFFRRFGLDAVEYTLSKPSWPAPARLVITDIGRPKKAGLFAARKLSQGVSRLRPGRWGSRFFYAGRRRGEPAQPPELGLR